MRRNLSLSLESFQPSSRTVVSLEEEQIMMTDATILASDINQELNEAERIVELSDALEDLAVIADQIEAASPTEIALIETAGDMAVAGTDIESNEIVPSLESYRGKKIATEGFQQTAKQIWQNIQDFLKKIWEKITGFFNNIFGVIPSLRRRLDELTEKVNEIDNLITRGTVFEVDINKGGNSSVISRLLVDGKVPRNDNDLFDSLNAVRTFAKFVYGANIINRNALGVSISDAIERFNPQADLESQAQLIVDACNKYNNTQTYPGKKGKIIPSGSYDLSQSMPLMGGAYLTHKLFKQADSTTTLGNMDRLRRSFIMFNSDANQNRMPFNSVKLPILSQNTLHKLISEMRGILDLIEEYKTGAASKAVEATRKRLEAASKKAAANNKDDATNNSNSQQAIYLKAMLNFNISYNRWVSDPSVPFAQYAISEINAVIAYTKMCIAVYKQNK